LTAAAVVIRWIRICGSPHRFAILHPIPKEMFVMQRFRLSMAATAVALALAAGNASAQFTNIFFFGDSLTDAGSFKPVLPPGTGLFTTNPGPCGHKCSHSVTV
jgi:hypothetical protein